MQDIIISTEKDNEYIRSKLREYNSKYMKGFDNYNFHIKEDNKIIGGIIASSLYDILEIEFLFIDENYRGKNLGTKLIAYIEGIAKKNGIKRILLNTYSFQAPEFYKKLGYSQLFSIEPCFEKYNQYYFIKYLQYI